MNGGFLGEIFTSLSFASALVASLAFLFAATRKGQEVKTWQTLGKASFIVHGLSVFGVIVTMFALIYNHEYQYHYIWSHSSNELPVYYMISCFWEGQEGSFLLWTFWHVVLGGIVLFKGGAWRDIVVGIIASVNLVLASMILGTYVPKSVSIILYLLAVLIPLGYLVYRFFQKKDDLNSKGVIHLAASLLGIISIYLALSGKSGFFAFFEIGSYFNAEGIAFLIAFIFWLALLIFFVAKMLIRLGKPDDDSLDVKEIFSILALLCLGFIAYTTDFGSFKIGSSPFTMLKDIFPDTPIFQSNPDFKPINGNGLNPLLQNYWMVIHPPTLFLGFASTVIPFAYALGGLMTKRYTEWMRPAIPWLIFSVMILGIGIIMGGYWAYETLNFGGYWNWDPVENSSLVPWIAGIASLHALIAYRKSKAFLKMTMFLVTGTFLLVLYSTFLTRSGILGETSVHAFTDLGMSGQLIMLMLVYILWMAAIFIANWNKIPVSRKSIEIKSAEFVLFFGVITLILIGMIVTIATSIPVFNAILGTRWAPVSDGSFFYFRWTIWLTILLALFSGLGQFMYWKKVKNNKTSKALMRPYLLAIVLASTIIFSIVLFTNWEFAFEHRYQDWKEFADLSTNPIKMGMRYLQLAFFIFTDEILLFAALFMIFANLDVAIGLMRSSKKGVKISGGSIAHIGFGLMLVGILFSSGYDQVISKNINPNELAALPQDARIDNVLLEKGQPKDIIDYRVTYLGKKEAQAPIHDLKILFESEDEFKVSFEDSTNDVYALQLPRLVFLNKDKKLDMTFVEEFLNDKLAFLKPKHINERTLYGLRFEPRKVDENGEPYYLSESAFTLYPEAEVNATMGLIAHPSRKILLTKDIYVHVSTIPKTEEEEARFKFYNFEPRMGDTVHTARAAIFFESINSLPIAGTDFALIAQVNLKIVTIDGLILTAEPLYRINHQNQISVKDHFLEEIHSSIAFTKVEPQSGKIGLQVQERVNPPEDIVVIQAIRKPYINFLWLGTFVLVIGFVIAMVRRMQENRKLGGKSMVEKEEYEGNENGQKN